MDDTAEILARLNRIGALTGTGAARSDVLLEVRGLLEEGERRLRTEQPAGDDCPDGPTRAVVPKPTDAGSTSPGGSGKEETVP